MQIHILQDNTLDENGLKRIRHILADCHFPILAKDKEFDIKAASKQAWEEKLLSEIS